MKASELITQLQALIDKHGDLQVFQNDEWDPDSLEAVGKVELDSDDGFAFFTFMS